LVDWLTVACQTIPERGIVRSLDPFKCWGHQSYLWNGWSRCCQILFISRLWQVI